AVSLLFPRLGNPLFLGRRHRPDLRSPARCSNSAGETGPCHAKASIFFSASAHIDSDKPSAARCQDVATDGSSASRSRSVSFSDLLRAGPTETVFPLSSRMLRMGLSPSV